MSRRVRLVVVGKPAERRLAAVHDDYAGRIARFGIDYGAVSVRQERHAASSPAADVLAREGRRLLEHLDPRETVVALDRQGRLLTSEDLASRLGRWITPGVVFVVGGPLGLHAGVLERADVRWSLSTLTFPHELVRVLVAEQVYRALSILHGLPYHRGSA